MPNQLPVVLALVFQQFKGEMDLGIRQVSEADLSHALMLCIQRMNN